MEQSGKQSEGKQQRWPGRVKCYLQRSKYFRWLERVLYGIRAGSAWTAKHLLRFLFDPLWFAVILAFVVGFITTQYFWEVGRVGGWVDRNSVPVQVEDPNLLSIAKDLALGGTTEIMRGLVRGGESLAEKAGIIEKKAVDIHGYSPEIAVVHTIDLMLPGVSLGEADRWIPNPAFPELAGKVNLFRASVASLGWFISLAMLAGLIALANNIRRILP